MTARPAPTLRAERITSGYGGVPVVRDVSIHVGPGEVVAIHGPNGAGQSTPPQSTVGLLRFTAARVLAGGGPGCRGEAAVLAAADLLLEGAELKAAGRRLVMESRDQTLRRQRAHAADHPSEAELGVRA